MPRPFGNACRPVALLLATTLAGCSASDPATEAPVELLPGEYRVTLTGGGMAAALPVNQGPGADDEKICIARADDSETVSKLARQYLAMYADCSHSANDRVGNSVGGKLSCPTDQQRAPGGEITTTYSGALTAESVTLEGKIAFDLPQTTGQMTPEQQAMLDQGKAAMESISMVVKAERVGECS